MAKIKELTEQQLNGQGKGIVYPKTKTKAVYDDNGNNLDYLLLNNKGDSAYQVAVSQGFEGTKSEWLQSLKGKEGLLGPKGDTVIIGDKQNYTLYNTLGENTDGAMTLKAVKDVIDELKGIIKIVFEKPEDADPNKIYFVVDKE